ncbi:hypothetical protein [Massilia sp. METH4]|uniref:hypothetical protein n=1 Tax=Massilia sp. METH4 TaxID=3123041 RepID=UPI0030D55F3F
MRPDSHKVRAVIERNVAELDHAAMKLAAHGALPDTPGVGPANAPADTGAATFLALARQALYNDALSGTLRVFDDHKDAHSLWYVLRCQRKEAIAAAAACGIGLEALEETSARLRRIRNRTQFHIDRQSIGDPPETWHRPPVDAGELAAAVHAAAALLAAVAHLLDPQAPPLRLSPYDGADARALLRAAASRGSA